MSKPFFEVFPTLKLNDDLWILFESARVTKVVTNSSRDFIKVHLLSRHLIGRIHGAQETSGDTSERFLSEKRRNRDWIGS